MSTTKRRRLGTRRLTIHALAVISAALLTLAIVIPVARADAVFHTERIALSSYNGSPLRSGAVVDIHANGPVVYAHENYILNGASPNTPYRMQTLVYPGASNCTGLLGILPDASINTNPAGNGEADHVLTPEQVAAFRGTTLDLIWQVMSSQGVAYQTGCISVALD